MQLWSYRPNPINSAKLVSAFESEGCDVVDGSDVMWDVRLIKSAAEIEVMEEAGRVCDIGHRAIEAAISPGVTELDVYGEMMRAMARAAGETAALVLGIKAGGMRFVHGLSSRRVLREGDHVSADICGVVHRYHTNLCRAYFLGEPPAELVDRYEKAAGVYPVFHEVAKAGTPINDVTRALRAYYVDVGLWDRRQELQGWQLGYELGASFPPDWVGRFAFSVPREDQEGIFEHNMVTNYESFFGTTLIDTVVYEPEGARRLLSLSPELVTIG